jgi:hypothetical protein
MGGLENIISNVFEPIVTLFAAIVVWVVLIAGLYQLVRDRIRQIHITS